MVVIADSMSAALRDALATAFTGATTTVIVRREPEVDLPGATVHVATRTEQRALILAAVPAPDTIVDLSRRPNDKQGALRRLFGFLADGGVYLSADASTTDSDAMRAALEELAAAPEVPDELPVVRDADPVSEARERAFAVRSFARVGDDVVVVKQGDHLRKLRDWDADGVLTARLGTTWGATLLEEPAFTFEPTNTVTVYGEGLVDVARRSFDVPEMRVRVYEGATIAARQLVTLGDLVAPDSFRHPHQGRLHNGKVLAFSSPYVGRLQPDVPREPTGEVEGALFHLDTEYPNHFGHITTEVLARCWGWEHARALEPGLRPLVAVGPGQPGVAQFQLDLLAGVGIDMSDPVVIWPGQRLRVERLYAATPQFENPHHTHPRLADVWSRLADGLGRGPSPVANERVFISRRHAKRECLNREEIEAFFADAGYAVVYPEQYSYAEQCAIFSQARLLAGFGGSGMFGMMFARRARVVIISGDGYHANNEELMAATNGNELHYFWGTSVDRPARAYDHSVLNSDFTFDLDRFRTELSAAIR
ncbi:glycosyltransferase family 61 protein [Cellulomonas alba]|uniref:Glycosyltransferase 61 family protein n=1 Tax=Cellulomonas alba TaxID=3053467 RepID=A0ABT7SES5_9CELL|nr:glycosyltransferase 61 family protein [Cellulomonas alba]MDM7854039.1 glycosyltransferase 61 family protein [Cellulomonas alba]